MSTPVPPHLDHRPGLGSGGFTDEQFREFVRLVRSLPGRWLIERREDDTGAASVLLMQDRDDTDDGLVFALSRRLRRVDLDLRRGSRPEFLGGFETTRQAMDHISHLVGQTGVGGASDARRR